MFTGRVRLNSDIQEILAPDGDVGHQRPCDRDQSCRSQRKHTAIGRQTEAEPLRLAIPRHPGQAVSSSLGYCISIKGPKAAVEQTMTQAAAKSSSERP
jgi:hypothetical protein